MFSVFPRILNGTLYSLSGVGPSSQTRIHRDGKKITLTYFGAVKTPLPCHSWAVPDFDAMNKLPSEYREKNHPVNAGE